MSAQHYLKKNLNGPLHIFYLEFKQMTTRHIMENTVKKAQDLKCSSRNIS